MKYAVYTNQTIEVVLDKHVPSIVVTGSKFIKKIPTFRKENLLTYFRFSAAKPGKYKFKNQNKTYSISVIKYNGRNNLYKLGEIKLNKKNLRFENGPEFFLLSDTIWFGMTNRIDFEKFKKHIDLRRKQGFNSIQFVVGIPPEVEIDSKNAQNEGGLPFINGKINIRYFDFIDRRIEYIAESGLIPVIYGSWGHHMDIVGPKSVREFWHEIVARYASYPVIFCLSGEIDVDLGNYLDFISSENALKKYTKKAVFALPYSVSSKVIKLKQKIIPKKSVNTDPESLNLRLKEWNKVGSYLKNLDSYNRLVTAHPQKKETVNKILGNPKYLDLDAIQAGHDISSSKFILDSIRNSTKPILNLETWYEGITNKFYNKYQRIAFWYTLLSGACGFSYGAHGVWQVSGKDNFLKHWGNSSYSKAIRYTSPYVLGKSLSYIYKNFDLKSIKVLPLEDSSDLPGVSANFNGKYKLTYLPNLTKSSYNIDLKRTKFINPENMSFVSPKTRFRKDVLILEKIK